MRDPETGFIIMENTMGNISKQHLMEWFVGELMQETQYLPQCVDMSPKQRCTDIINYIKKLERNGREIGSTGV